MVSSNPDGWKDETDEFGSKVVVGEREQIDLLHDHDLASVDNH
jgi:hypothetical protein